MTKSPIIDNQTAKELITQLINIIQKEKTLSDLKSNIKDFKYFPSIEKLMPGKNYPRLQMQLTHCEIEDLQDEGILSKEGILMPHLATGKISDNLNMTALEKLLYSMIWKNGDLGKERHIVGGIRKAPTQKTGKVFYEFGGYLSGRNSFILDQHTLRCFAVQASESDDQIEIARRLKIIDETNDRQKTWIKDYMKFFEETKCRLGNNSTDYLYEVDRLFFGAGKFIKILNN